MKLIKKIVDRKMYRNVDKIIVFKRVRKIKALEKRKYKYHLVLDETSVITHVTKTFY